MTGVALLPAELVSVVIETLLFGVCLVLSFIAVYVLIFKRGLTQASRTSITRSNRVWLAVAVTLTGAAFAVSNVASDVSRIIQILYFYQHWVVNICRAFDAFIYQAEDPGTLVAISNLADPKYVLKTGIYIFQGLLADSVLVSALF